MPLNRPQELNRVGELGQSNADDLRLRRFENIVQLREIRQWRITAGLNGVNIDAEQFPYTTHGVIVEIRANGKVAGGAPAVAAIRNNGTIVANVTVTLAGTLYTAAPAASAAIVSPSSKLTLDLATSVGWTFLVVEAIIEPTLEG